MKNNRSRSGKITIAVLSSLFFLCAAFWIIIYYFGAFSYLYHSNGVLYDFCLACALILAAVIVLIVLIRNMFKAGKFIRVVSVIILTVAIPLFAFSSFILMLLVGLFGPNGCSYTEDIENYGKYDENVEHYIPSYFPEDITDEMNVVQYVYFDKYVDIEQSDFYLEVRFESKEIMDKYLTSAKEKMLGNNSTDRVKHELFEYRNVYDANYTDVILCHSVSGEWKTYNRIEFFVENHPTVDMDYKVISYSYDDLTIIYSKTFLTRGDILYGNDHDAGNYCPVYLQRFDVTYDPKNSLTREDIMDMIAGETE